MALPGGPRLSQWSQVPSRLAGRSPLLTGSQLAAYIRQAANWLPVSGGCGMNEVFKALADPSRRQLLDRLNERNGQTLRELCAGLGMARQSVTKHLAVLEAAGLVMTLRRGREKLHFL